MFHLPFFENFSHLLSGSIAGLVFGFLLQKAHVTRFNTIVKQLLLKDFTVMKVIFTAIITGSIGIYFLLDTSTIYSLLSNATFSAVIIGGLIFGTGMATLGYCPGTAIGALADGSRDIIYGILGMFFGAFIFAEIYPILSKFLTLQDNQIKMTLSQVFNMPSWMVIFALFVFAYSFFRWLEIKDNPQKNCCNNNRCC